MRDTSLFATGPHPLALHSRLYPPRGATTCRTLRAAALLFWYGIAVLPCFSASGNVPRHSLWSPLTGHLCRECPSWDTSLRGAEGPVKPELHRGVRGKYQLPNTSCFYRTQLIFLEHWQRRITRKRSLPWCRRQDLNLHTQALLCCGRNALPIKLHLHTPGIRRGQEERKERIRMKIRI